MWVLSTVEKLRVGDRIQAPLGPREIMHKWRGVTHWQDRYSIGLCDTTVVWMMPNSPIEVWREEVQ